LELRGIATIANAIGVAITNFRNFHDMSKRFGDIAIAVSAMEVASAVRHETAGIIDRVNGNMGPVEEAIPASNGPAQEAIEELLTELDLLQEALEKFKIATSSPTKEPVHTSIEEAFEEAKKTVGGRLDTLHIDCRFDGPPLELLAYKDWLRHAFLNLILNSMDAFEVRSNKRGREIRVLTERPSPRAESVAITYTDNAEGIATHLLLGPTDTAELPARQRIFAPYVTSKKEGYEPKPGSGLGLFLVRKVLADHGGSIDLASTGSTGSTFKLRLPTALLESGKEDK
jgi:signal transduction histidine kinase